MEIFVDLVIKLILLVVAARVAVSALGFVLSILRELWWVIIPLVVGGAFLTGFFGALIDGMQAAIMAMPF